MKKQLVGLILITSLCSSAQESSVDENTATKNQHFMGLHAGTSTGAGFSYKYINNNKFGIQLTGIPIARSDNNYTDFWSSAGLALTYRFGESQFNNDPIRFLVYAGANHLYSYSSYTNYYNNGTPYQDITDRHQVNTAVGFGLEYTTIKRLNFNIMAGYGLYLDGGIRTNLSIEAGLHYRLGK